MSMLFKYEISSGPQISWRSDDGKSRITKKKTKKMTWLRTTGLDSMVVPGVVTHGCMLADVPELQLSRSDESLFCRSAGIYTLTSNRAYVAAGNVPLKRARRAHPLEQME
mmetsp:Transcript_3164/g.5994  ORF Transcript_3164/g.5994 Transcript_3164/m.5994 type:complete len:110 (+) Transcript_3164:2060-2389(+)